MKSYTSSKTGLFLMEIILALFFFSIAATVCMELFVGAHNTSKTTEALHFASITASNLAESYIANKGTPPITEPVYYNKNWEVTSPDKSIYKVLILPSTDTSIDIQVYHIAESVPFYCLPIKYYNGGIKP